MCTPQCPLPNGQASVALLPNALTRTIWVGFVGLSLAAECSYSGATQCELRASTDLVPEGPAAEGPAAAAAVTTPAPSRCVPSQLAAPHAAPASTAAPTAPC
mmetsp:Transcript_41410/g.123719  ORF Transcript_41410/g.123719 Transcript_41410/m.123719 type:complete len:102 (-) Transcript_41410:1726-2031(-)